VSADVVSGEVVSSVVEVATVSGSLTAGARSAQDGLAVVQTADSALNDVSALLRRMDLIAALCGPSTDLDPSAKAALQDKFEALQVEVKRIQVDASWNGIDVLAGHDLAFKTGPRTHDTVTIDGATTLSPVDVSHASITDRPAVQAAAETVDSRRADLASLKDRFGNGLREVASTNADPAQLEQARAALIAQANHDPDRVLQLLL
jgi:flagellin